MGCDRSKHFRFTALGFAQGGEWTGKGITLVARLPKLSEACIMVSGRKFVSGHVDRISTEINYKGFSRAAAPRRKMRAGGEHLAEGKEKPIS